jgi:DNA-directed RNA polymerase beta' subunit
MKLDMFNIRDFIKANKLVPVTDPVSLTSAKMPSPSGIFSYEIFGYTTDDRKNTFSYIDLNGKFFHPECLKVLNRMGSLGKIVSRDKYAVVANKKIKIVDQKDFKDAETGLDFFYDNWEGIDWQSEQFSDGDETDADEISIDKKTRIKFFKYLKKNEAFIDAWLVLPPYYRDMNSEDVTLGDDINKLYNRLISQTKALKAGFGFSSFGDITKDAIQSTIMMLYDTTMNPVTGKTVDLKKNGELAGNAKRSLLRRNLIGRFLDFSASSVITSPVSSTT